MYLLDTHFSITIAVFFNHIISYLLFTLFFLISLLLLFVSFSFFFFFNDTATTEIYTLSLHDALPIWVVIALLLFVFLGTLQLGGSKREASRDPGTQSLRDYFRGLPELFRNRGLILLRSEEHTSELQSQSNLVCRLLLEKKKKQNITSK